MTKRLIVMRHAKSSWTSGAATDHARPLNGRGRRDAPRVAERLVARGWKPDHVLSSDSARTRETFARMGLSPAPPATFTRSLYHADVDAFVDEVGLVDDDVDCLLVLGHNPTWEEVAWWLTGEEVRMTTANAALLTAAGASWREMLVQGVWSIEEVIRPREL